MSTRDEAVDRGIGFLVGLAFSSPIAAVVTLLIGATIFGAFLMGLFNIQLMIVAILGTSLITLSGKQNLNMGVPLFALFGGFLYWAFGIFSFVRSNGLLDWWCSIPWIGQGSCGVGAALTFPTLIADILVILFWSSILGAIAKKAQS